jgi:hypothetical protein
MWGDVSPGRGTGRRLTTYANWCARAPRGWRGGAAAVGGVPGSTNAVPRSRGSMSAQRQWKRLDVRCGRRLRCLRSRQRRVESARQPRAACTEGRWRLAESLVTGDWALVVRHRPYCKQRRIGRLVGEAAGLLACDECVLSTVADRADRRSHATTTTVTTAHFGRWKTKKAFDNHLRRRA